jgi:tRNA(Ile)-lysidine synthase
VCLLTVLADLAPRWGWRLGVLHCDHRWRADSAANAAFVRDLAVTTLGLPEADVRTAVAPGGAEAPAEGGLVSGVAAEARGGGGEGRAGAALPRTERAAREWRYSEAARVAADSGFEVVVTAHTATDRCVPGRRVGRAVVSGSWHAARLQGCSRALGCNTALLTAAWWACPAAGPRHCCSTC